MDSDLCFYPVHHMVLRTDQMVARNPNSYTGFRCDASPLVVCPGGVVRFRQRYMLHHRMQRARRMVPEFISTHF